MFRTKRKEVYVWALVAQVTLAYYRICAWDEWPLFGLVTPQQQTQPQGKDIYVEFFFANNFKKRSIFILFKNTSRNKSLWIIVTINSVKLNNQFQSLYDSEVIDISIH